MGSPVIFQVALVRVTPGGPVPIEETIIRTLDGSSVSYSFQRKSADASNADGASESLELTLLPRRMSDEILMVDASVDLRRSTPDGGPQAEPLLVKRSQAMTKGSAFELKLDKAPGSEDPYRLIIHAQF